MDIGPWELIIVLGLAVLLFGSAKIPELARSIGSAKKEYERGLRGEPDHDDPAPAEPLAAVAEGSAVEDDPARLVGHGADDPTPD